jgi:hypothetical protein
MIAKPTTEQLIDAVRLELQTRVAPLLSDPIARMALDMSIAILGSAAVRSAHEVGWMLEEADAIEAVARRLVERLPDPGPVGEALADCERHAGAVADMAALHARYAAAGEVLARLGEAAYDAGDADAIREVWALLEQRRAHQDAVTGGYTAVGRA